jgi:hypothetical protein
MDGAILPGARAGAQAPLLYALSVLVVFLCLAALYESWSIPFAVMLVVPLGVLGAVLFHLARPGERRVLPGRPADHRGPVGQERDPDRGVRQASVEHEGMDLVDSHLPPCACACARS